MGLFKSLKYFPIMLADSYNFTSLAVGATDQSIFDYTKIYRLSNRIATLRNFETVGTAGVTVTITADDYNTTPVDASAQMGITPNWPLTDSEGYDDLAASTLRASATNATAAVVDNFWSRWSVLVENPSIAQKLQYPSYILGSGNPLDLLSPAEQKLAQQYGLVPPKPRGVLPRTFEWVRNNEYKTQIIRSNRLGTTQTVNGANTAAFVNENAQEDEMLVLVALYVTPGTSAENIKTIIGVDEDEEFYTMTNYTMFSAGRPIPLFVQATSNLTISCTSSSSVDTTVTAVVWHCRLSEEIKWRLGMPGVPAEVAAKLTTGVL